MEMISIHRQVAHVLKIAWPKSVFQLATAAIAALPDGGEVISY